MREDVIVRAPRREDLAAIVALYNHYVVTSHITFDIHPVSVEQRQEWFEGFSSTGPHRLLVAESDGRIVGYATSSRFRHKAAYARSVETTIYLDHQSTGRGIGAQLYGSLLDGLRAHEEVHQAYAGVTVPNPGSIALHEKLGFQVVGTFRDAGYKFGKYWSVRWYQRTC